MTTDLAALGATHPEKFSDEPTPEPEHLIGPQAAQTEPPTPQAEEEQGNRYPFRPGGSFILDADPDPVAIWGAGAEVLAARGEALVIAGSQGVGKTTLGQQYALGRCGFEEYADLLGWPILPGNKRVLYLAMDRPQQAARSMRRMVGEAWRGELDERLAVWPGPPPYDMAKYPRLLADLCQQAGADTVIVDSLKDAFIGLTDDEAAAGWNRARQTVITDGVEVLELHHLRKAPNGVKAAAPAVDDIYGSTWLTSGCGSVILLTGAPGDPIVGLHHLKQPADAVGPLKVIHEVDTGRTEVWHATDLLTLAARPGGITAADAAVALFDTDRPDMNAKNKARRRLEKLERQGLLVVADKGDPTTNTATRWEVS